MMMMTTGFQVDKPPRASVRAGLAVPKPVGNCEFDSGETLNKIQSWFDNCICSQFVTCLCPA